MIVRIFRVILWKYAHFERGERNRHNLFSKLLCMNGLTVRIRKGQWQPDTVALL